jgi:hypothetical protein
MISVHNGEFWADGFRERAPAAAGGLVLRRRGRRAVDQPAAGWAAAVSVRRMPRRRWHHVPADPRACRQARAQAQRQRDPVTDAPLPHNTARRAFTALMLDELTRRAAGQLGGRRILAPGDEQDLRAELAAEPAIRRALDVLWPELTPEQLLALLYTEPRRLDLTEDERAALAKPASPVAWTAADVPLLDELAELLGDTDAAERRAASGVPSRKPSAPRRSSMRRRSWTISARPAPSRAPMWEFDAALGGQAVMINT